MRVKRQVISGGRQASRWTCIVRLRDHPDINLMRVDFPGIRIEDFLYEQLLHPRSQWSIGTFGAIAEFSRVGSEDVTIERQRNRLAAVSARGGISIQLDAHCRPFAFESIAYQGWSQQVALCMKIADARMSARAVLTEIGEDADALRSEDRDGVLFDLGIAAPHIDFCIRVRDARLLAWLREHEGRPLYGPDNPALGAILEASPHRVFISRMGRAEVFQRIPCHGEKSPEGPHTHLLPRLLKQRRTHAATEPIPDGYVPCAHVYPWHPADVSLGNEPMVDLDQHRYFQMVLRSFGAPEAIAIKDMVRQSVIRGQNPPVEAFVRSRVQRASVRIALRQLKALSCESTTLSNWIAAFDRVQSEDNSREISAGECVPSRKLDRAEAMVRG